MSHQWDRSRWDVGCITGRLVLCHWRLVSCRNRRVSSCSVWWCGIGFAFDCTIPNSLQEMLMCVYSACLDSHLWSEVTAVWLSSFAMQWRRLLSISRHQNTAQIRCSPRQVDTEALSMLRPSCSVAYRKKVRGQKPHRQCRKPLECSRSGDADPLHLKYRKTVGRWRLHHGPRGVYSAPQAPSCWGGHITPIFCPLGLTAWPFFIIPSGVAVAEPRPW